MLPQKPKFLKRIKPKKRQEIREVNQKTMNFLFLGGLTVIIALQLYLLLQVLLAQISPRQSSKR